MLCSSSGTGWKARSRHTCDGRGRKVRLPASRGYRNAPLDSDYRESAATAAELQLLACPFLREIFLLFESDPMRALFDLSTLLRIRHFLRHPIKFLQYDRLAAHSSHERENQRALLVFVQGGAGLGIEHAAAADAAQS